MLTLKHTAIFVSLSLIFTVLICATYLSRFSNYTLDKSLKKMGQSIDAPPSLQMFNIIESASDSFNIPRYILYNVAYLETHYQGPFDWQYNPYLTSPAGAVGPMQIIPKFAPSFHKGKISAKELKNNLKLNVEVSCKMLKFLYKQYGRWDLVLGYYNTGYPNVNEYAVYASSNKDYKNRWIKIDF